MKIPEKIDFRGKKYSKYSIHNKKGVALREADKVRIEGHLAAVKSFPQKHVVYIKRKKIVPYPPLKRETCKLIEGQRFDMVTFSYTKKNAERHAKKYKGIHYDKYRIFKEKIKF